MTDPKYLSRTWSSTDADDLKYAAETKGAYFTDEAENDSDSYNIVTRHSDYLEDGDDEVTVAIDFTCGDDRSIDVATARTVATFDGECSSTTWRASEMAGAAYLPTFTLEGRPPIPFLFVGSTEE